MSDPFQNILKVTFQVLLIRFLLQKKTFRRTLSMIMIMLRVLQMIHHVPPRQKNFAEKSLLER